jgi:thioredoxin 1
MTGFILGNFWLIFPSLLTIVAAIVLLTRGPKWTDFLAFGAIVTGLAIAWLTLHPRQTPLLGDAASVQAAILESDVPVLLEFQSPYCIVCTQLRPVVDRIEMQSGGRLAVIRVNIQESTGRDLARHYAVEFAPTFIFIDAQGEESWREVGGIDAARVLGSIE